MPLVLYRLIRLTLWLELPGLPGPRPDYENPPNAASPEYFEVLERNTHIVYPVLAVLVLLVLIAGILQA